MIDRLHVHSAGHMSVVKPTQVRRSWGPLQHCSILSLCETPKRLSVFGENVSQMSGGYLGSHAPTLHCRAMPAEGRPLPVDISPQRPRRKTVIFTPVPQTFTSGFSGLLTMKSAKARHSLSAPEPTSKPSTG